jgi:hypothetical protein
MSGDTVFTVALVVLIVALLPEFWRVVRGRS